VEYPQTATHHATGTIATLLTADGAPMVVSYATNLPGQSQDHTGTQVRIAAPARRHTGFWASPTRPTCSSP